MRINEIFGPTIQGEGPAAGSPAVFVRTAGCNLQCTWCDTYYAWDWTRVNRATEERIVDVSEVVDKVRSRAPSGTLVVLTGGEPLLQMSECEALAHAVQGYYPVDVETAGTILPSPRLRALVRRFVVSPKLKGSGNTKQMAQRSEVLFQLAHTENVVFKFVISDLGDLTEAEGIVDEYKIPRDWVYMMPVGSTRAELERMGPIVADWCARWGWNYTDRLHIRLWDNKRGV